MLINLTIKNLALIDYSEIEFNEGFSVFTGETGAGKSVIMGAIGLLLGNRAISEQIRRGEDKAEVSGTFTFKEIPNKIAEILNENEIDTNDNELIIRRVISKSGRNKIMVNQVQVPLATLKEIGNNLIDLHGQHDHQTLLQEDAPYDIIDNLKSVAPTKRVYTNAYNDLLEATNNLNSHKKKVKELIEKRDFLQFQYDEISKLDLKENEEEELNEEFRLISSVTERANLSAKIGNILEGDGINGSIKEQLSELTETISTLADIDSSFSNWQEDLLPFQDILDELSNRILSYNISLREEANPSRVDYINSRIAKIQRLKKKYLCDFNELIKKQKQLEEELQSIDNFDSDTFELEKAIKAKREKVIEIGQKLSQLRTKACQKFDTEITKEMNNLGFNGGAFKSEFINQEEPTTLGLEKILFTARTNKGEDFMPLYKTASGGEISRIMLAIKSILAENDTIPILIFDEIDTGVGGEIGKDIATTMVKLSKTHQIFVITHLQQIATKADNHYLVYKIEKNGRTITEIEELNKKKRIKEIARMIGDKSELAEKHAEVLLEEA